VLYPIGTKFSIPWGRAKINSQIGARTSFAAFRYYSGSAIGIMASKIAGTGKEQHSGNCMNGISKIQNLNCLPVALWLPVWYI